jgi:riboflavin synthase
MFTGIIEEVGKIIGVSEQRGKRQITISCSRILPELRTGDSVAVSGVCLTAIDITAYSFSAYLAEETWKRTSLGRLKPTALVNLELSMRADGRFGGHIVQGHVDGTGRILSLDPIENAADYRLSIEIPPAISRYVISQGSLCIEGISLTVADLVGNRVEVAIIPHTIQATNLQSLKIGDLVNLEVDMIAKYVEKMMRPLAPHSITIKELVRQGF